MVNLAKLGMMCVCAGTMVGDKTVAEGMSMAEWKECGENKQVSVRQDKSGFVSRQSMKPNEVFS